jgi:hypothetical protein
MDMTVLLKQCLIWLKPGLAWGAGISALIVPTSLLTVYHTDPTRLSFLSTDPQADLRHDVPFDILDAVEECKLETQDRLSDVLVRSRVNWHSTRFQPDRNVFVVALQADIGSLRSFEQANVYCYINPRSQKVSYFNAYDAEGKSYMSRAISFESVMKAFSGD